VFEGCGLSVRQQQVPDLEQAHTRAADCAAAQAPPATPAATDVDEARQKRWRISVAFSAACVLVLDGAEAVGSLYFLRMLGWNKTFLAGIMLKFTLLSMFTYLAEGVLQSHCFCSVGFCGFPLQVWVRAHRMARDIVTSLLILCPMVPLVLLNSLNDYLCPSCSIWMLLIYRDPGHLVRKEVEVVDMFG